MFRAIWSGAYPNLCSGSWMLFRDDTDISYLIPEEMRKSPMNTFGVYQSWTFDESYSEQFEDYEDGLKCEEWAKANPWVAKIVNSPDELEDLFLAFQEQDWRHNSCGGCIQH